MSWRKSCLLLATLAVSYATQQNGVDTLNKKTVSSSEVSTVCCIHLDSLVDKNMQ